MSLPKDVIFVDPDRDIERHHKNLPHWQQDGATFFLTFRLDDSIPRHLLKIWQDERDIWLRLHPEPWSSQIEDEYHVRFPGRIDRWLDEGHGSNLLLDPRASGIVASVLQTFDGIRYSNHAWVVMSNHVHALFTLHTGYRLKNTVKSWKGVSARKINALLSRQGSLWMMDYFDRLIRDEAHFWRCASYIRGNPSKAGMDVSTIMLHESDSVREHLNAAGA